MHLVAGLMLTALLVLAGFANLARFATKHATSIGIADAIAMISFAGTLVALMWWCRQAAPVANERRAVTVLLASSFLLKLFLAFSLGHIPQTADRLFTAQFIDRWVEGGSAALRALSWEYYDYPLWSGRAWPFLYPVRVWMGSESFIMASLLFNAFISTLLCGCVYLVLRPHIRRPLIPLVFAVTSTPYTWQVIEYGYQYQGGLFLLTGIYILNEFNRKLDTGFGHLCWLVAGQALVYFLLFLQQGLELVLAAVSLVFAVYTGISSRSWKVLGRMLMVCLILPLVISYPSIQPVKSYFERHDEGRLSSHFIGHMAMGWNLVTWGEYHGPVVALDRRTPLEQKNQVMKEYLMEQITSRPFDALVKLPVIKLIKLFQVGAASGAEENLDAANEERWLMIAKATRIVYAPVLLFLAAIGCVRFFVRNGDAVFSWALLVLAFVFAYTFFSETSPRYSFFFLFVLIACASEGLDYLVSFFSQPQRARSMK